jgi:enoyl-CoA hydratase
MSESLRVVVETRGTVRVVLARPPLNLLEPRLISELAAAFRRLNADPAVRIAVISAEGRAFSGGVDVRVLKDLDPASARELISSLRDAIDAVFQAPFPTLAAVHGACLGGAFELALACDMRVAAEDAVFGLPEVRVGVPSVIHAALLPSMAGPAIAAEMLLTGSTLTAADALRAGLVNRVVPKEQLAAATDAIVDAVLACAPNAVRLQKRLIVDWRQARIAEAIDRSVDVFAGAFETGEPREGAGAFLEKRPPAW